MALGLLPATIALACGLFFFFVYAARYYVYVAILLFLNATRGNGNGNANGNRDGNGNGNGKGNGRNRMFGRLSRTNSNRNGNAHSGDGKGNRNGNSGSVNHSALNGGLITQPLVSIHLPLFNEPNVVERLLTACTSLDYNNYEVVVVDDSTDKTLEMLRSWAEANQISFKSTDGGTRTAEVQVTNTLASMQVPIKIVHRTKRSGFKGGALNEALKHMNPEAEYVMIFDADFIPPPDIIKSFVAYYQTLSPSHLFAEITKLDKEYADGKISLDAYLSQRERLASKLRGRTAITESFRQGMRSLFGLDQLYAEKAIDEFEYALRRRAIINEMSKIPMAAEQYVQEPLALRRAFIVSQLFAEDKIDTSDFKTRMRSIFSPLRARARPSREQDSVLMQILDLDREYAQGNVRGEDYRKKRGENVTRLRTFTEDVAALKARFDLDQSFASGQVPFEQYLQLRVNTRQINGNRNSNGNGNSELLTLGNPLNRNGNGNRKGQTRNGNRNRNGNGNNFEYVAVQGYQLHNLNQSESWLTSGIRAEYSGSYMVERTCEQLFGAMRMISGSVYMIRADVLRQYQWAESITEDWELTCRLYLDGKRVGYTPTIEAAAECPSTIRRLIRQRQRWAEGHSHNVKRYFWKFMKSKNVTFREKLEFLYFTPYYIQGLFWAIGSTFWFISEYTHQFLPFWNAALGYSLVLSNTMAVPLMNLAGLITEGNSKDHRRDITGVASTIALTYILAVFQGYSALKGFLESKEGTWIRTYKTGIITETIRRFQVRRFLESLRRESVRRPRGERAGGRPRRGEAPLGVARIVRKEKAGVVLLLILTSGTLSLVLMASSLPSVPASADTTWYLSSDNGPTTGASYNKLMYQDSGGGGHFPVSGASKLIWFASSKTYSIPINAQTWTYSVSVTSSSYSSGSWIFQVGYVRTAALGTFLGLTSAHSFATCSPTPCDQTFSASDSQASPVTPSSAYYIVLQVTTPSDRRGSACFNCPTTGYLKCTQDIPEFAILAAPVVLFIPKIVSNRRKRRRPQMRMMAA